MFEVRKREQTAEKGITIIVHDTYSTDSETGKRMVSQRRIKDAVNMAMRVEEALSTELVEETSTEDQDNEVKPENFLAQYVTD